MERVKQSMRQLRDLLRGQGRSREDADDLIQEAFLRLHVFCQSEEVRNEDAFLARTARNLSVDLHRREHRALYVQERPEELGLVDLRPTPDEDLATRQRLNRVGTILDALSPRTREIFLMHRVDGHGCANIATQFGISVSAVEKHIARAVLALMDAVNRTEDHT